MIVCGSVTIYGAISLIRKWKLISPGGHSKLVLQLSGIISSGIVCYIVFLITGLFLDTTQKNTNITNSSYNFHLSASDDYTIENQGAVANYFKEFIQVCPAIVQKSENIDKIDIRLLDLNGFATEYEVYGWTKEIEILIHLKEKTNLPKILFLDGQILRYFLGGGHTPGIFAPGRNNAEKFAEMQIDDPDMPFINVSSFKNIDTIGGVHDPGQISKLNVNLFTPVFESSADFWIADGASEYISVVSSNNPFEIQATSLGGCIIKLYHDDTEKFIKNATFSYIYNGTKYQSEITYKLFLAFVSTLEMINNEDAGETVINLVQEIYSIKNNEEIRSIRGNIYSFEVQGDDFIYHAKTPYQ
jgi:hypothetical protein